MAVVGSFPFNSFLSGVLSCIGTAVLAGKQKQNMEFFVFVRIESHKERAEIFLAIGAVGAPG